MAVEEIRDGPDNKGPQGNTAASAKRMEPPAAHLIAKGDTVPSNASATVITTTRAMRERVNMFGRLRMSASPLYSTIPPVARKKPRRDMQSRRKELDPVHWGS